MAEATKTDPMMIILAFAAGCAIGANWPKIKKYLMQQKEQMEDMMAASEITKKSKKAKQGLAVAAVGGAAVAEEVAGDEEEAAADTHAGERQAVATDEMPVSSSES